MSELVVVFAACACSLLWAARHARRLALPAVNCREIERLLGAIQRACADLFWREAKLLVMALIALAAALAAPLLAWGGEQAASPLGRNVAGLCVGAAAGAVVAQLAHWLGTRTNAHALSALRRDVEPASTEAMRGASTLALAADALSLLLTVGVFAAHYLYLGAAAASASGVLSAASQSLPGVALGACGAAAIFHIGGSSFHTAAGVAGAAARSKYEVVARDEEQNPALVAELVGESVGGVVSRTLDGFASFVLVNAGSVLVAAAVTREMASTGGLSALAIASLPLLVRGIGVFASTVALASMRFDGRLPLPFVFAGGAASQAVVAGTGLLGAMFWLLGDGAYVPYFGAGVLGLIAAAFWTGRLVLWARRIREPSSESLAQQTSVARALGLGLQHTWLPISIVGGCFGIAYVIGARSPLPHGGAFGVVIAVSAMLGAGAFHLAECLFSAMCRGVARVAVLRRGGFDAAGHERARGLLHDAVAIGDLGQTQGILGSASAAVLVAVMLPWVWTRAPAAGEGVGYAHPVVLLGGLLGAGSVLSYMGGMLRTSSKAASALDNDLQNRLEAAPDATQANGALPSYRITVQLATSVSTEPILPLALSALLTPFALGAILRLAYGGGGTAMTAQALMAFAAIAALTGCSAALAAQGTLSALTAPNRASDSFLASTTGVAGGSASEFIGRCVQPAALFGLKAAVISSLAAAPLLS